MDREPYGDLVVPLPVRLERLEKTSRRHGTKLTSLQFGVALLLLLHIPEAPTLLGAGIRAVLTGLKVL